MIRNGPHGRRRATARGPRHKTGRPIINVLKEKHPALMIPDLESEEKWASFEKYGDALECVPVDCDQEAVMEVAAKL